MFKRPYELKLTEIVRWGVREAVCGDIEQRNEILHEVPAAVTTVQHTRRRGSSPDSPGCSLHITLSTPGRTASALRRWRPFSGGPGRARGHRHNQAE